MDKWPQVTCLHILHIFLALGEIECVFLNCVDMVFYFLKQEKGAFRSITCSKSGMMVRILYMKKTQLESFTWVSSDLGNEAE